MNEAVAESTEGYLWFDGIMEGPRGDESPLRNAVAAINAVGAVELTLEVDGGRFSLLADDTVGHRGDLDETKRDALVRAIEGLLNVLPESGEVESTLRCTEVCGEEVRETLFGVIGRELQPVGRSRPPREEDRQRVARAGAIDPIAHVLPFDRKLLPLIGGGILLLTILIAWQGGMLHRLFASQAKELRCETGPFGAMLQVEVESAWGNYEVEIKRGADFPASPEAVQAGEAKAETTAARVALNVVVNGQDVFVRLESEDGKVLAAQQVSLRRLVAREDAKVTLKLPGHMAAKRVVIGLDDGRDE